MTGEEARGHHHKEPMWTITKALRKLRVLCRKVTHLIVESPLSLAGENEEDPIREIQ